MAKRSAAANAFGSGQDLKGLKCRGKEIVNATRKYMDLSDGSRVERKGAHVQWEAPDFDRPAFDRKVSELKKDGYEVFKSLTAGQDSSYSFSKDGKKSGYGFDDRESVVKHIEEKEKGKE